ncbi:hypothetical protein SAPIO_CDS8815 [Scedosporium apiospermum]|uniref:Uncharacterized protein n=1 Tax=Pseudallescheria apiosperma TaxID=563466 RepID=A0A084FXQ8_PSEDA|nr:uncharacterized protein SAPIO_CDS8815 [Scedosporium apiospermum]KEZ39870.1 hypothetical protein SAPIO_CDS8815 [Scedosporium apiospermum]
MKLSTVLLAATALVGTSSAYKISVYSKDNYQGTQKSWSSNGSHSVGFTVKSWIWESSLGDGCCVAFCKGSTNVGRYCGSARKPVSSAGVNKVVTGCGSAVLNC